MTAIAEVRRNVVTPEGVTVPFDIAPVGGRLLAFVLDAFLVHLVVLAMFLTGAFLSMFTSGVALSVVIIASFLLRNFYFTVAELRWGGRTIGKRFLGLRVIARDGGALTAEAVIARNLTRDFEVFLPLVALMEPTWLVPAGPGWGRLLGIAWLVLPALLPLLNRDHLRVGDIVGGTLVVKAPRPRLLSDLTTVSTSAASKEADYRFTPAQLDLYGIHELQVLEDVIRGTGYRSNPKLVHLVSEKIREKIGWDGGPVDDARFLLAFYTAQRAHLEQRMLFGERREYKRD